MRALGSSNCEEAEVSVVIIRANGTVEDLGVVSYYHKNPLKRAMFRLKQWFGIKINSKKE